MSMHCDWHGMIPQLKHALSAKQVQKERKITHRHQSMMFHGHQVIAAVTMAAAAAVKIVRNKGSDDGRNSRSDSSSDNRT
eukprot:359832-Chlamydomonas_euryale.AAC.2